MTLQLWRDMRFDPSETRFESCQLLVIRSTASAGSYPSWRTCNDSCAIQPDRLDEQGLVAIAQGLLVRRARQPCLDVTSVLLLCDSTWTHESSLRMNLITSPLALAALQSAVLVGARYIQYLSVSLVP